MPHARHAVADAATQHYLRALHRGARIQPNLRSHVDDDKAYIEDTNALGRRLPSSRPIDHRWDRYRAIVFSLRVRPEELASREGLPEATTGPRPSQRGTRGRTRGLVHARRFLAPSTVRQAMSTHGVCSRHFWPLGSHIATQPAHVRGMSTGLPFHSEHPHGMQDPEIFARRDEDAALDRGPGLSRAQRTSNEAPENDHDVGESSDVQSFSLDYSTADRLDHGLALSRFSSSEIATPASTYCPSEGISSSTTESTTDYGPDTVMGTVRDTEEPAVPLTYQIPPTDYRSAVMASPNSSAAFWKYTLYRNPEGKCPERYYCTTFEQAEIQAQKFLGESVLGFDIEWEVGASMDKSAIKDNVSLIQIAAEDKIGLFQVAMFKGETVEQLMPPTLRKILESPAATKAGVNVTGDATRLSKCLNVEMKGLFELSHLYKVVMFSEQAPQKVNRVPRKLAEQVQNILLLPLAKGEVRTSAWSKRLNIRQTEYAASDAYAGFRLYHALEAKRKAMIPTPPRPAFYELHRPLVLGNGRVVTPRTRTTKRTAGGGDEVKAEENDAESEEFFDAVENLETYDTGQAATQDVAAASGSNSSPSLPSINSKTDLDTTVLQASTASPLPASERKPARVPKTSTQRPPSQEVAQADEWVAMWRASLPPEYKCSVGNATLRAYHLWHAQEFGVKAVASQLRDPPLANQTVASYVMEAIRKVNLPYDAERVREPLDILPPAVRGKYQRVLDRINA